MRNSFGFTLLEMLIYMAILVLVLGAVVSLFVWILRSSANVQAQELVHRNAQSALSVLTAEIRAARSIYTPTTSASQLSLETLKNLPAGETSTYVDFFLCDTRLCLKREGALPVALTTESVEVTGVTYTQAATGQVPSVQIVLDVEYVNPSGRPELAVSVTASSTASLRAY